VALSEGASATSDRTQADAAISATASTARGALQEMRGMLGVLRTDDPKGTPLTPLLAPPPHETVANAQRAGYPVTLSVMDAAELCPVVAHAVSRLVQEGVTNAMATTISVRITHADLGTTVTIVNDGVTDARQAPGFGLRGLTERMAHVHGSIEYGRVGDDRWMLRATVPPTAGTGEITIPPQIEATETRP
jgi:signal transduction histidine kinase